MGAAVTTRLTEMAGFIIAKIPAAKSSAIEKDILGGACRLFALFITGDVSVTDYVKLYDNSDPTGGTTAPDFSIPVAEVANLGGSHPNVFDPDGEPFANGLSVGADDAGGTALGTSPTACIVTLVLKRGLS
jgi:hypothetical protein